MRVNVQTGAPRQHFRCELDKLRDVASTWSLWYLCSIVARRIHVLDDALVDQIAAGEVVERPASVIKELLENALDAGARSIDVIVQGGGVEQIRVTDDGWGMGPEDAALSLQRHATSKIASSSDLNAISTLGFRGEALPAIASVSRLTLTTRLRDEVGATRIAIDGGSTPRIGEAGCAPGTIVDVRDLFYNVPARRKFLKSQATENAHIADACLRAALSTPELRLTLTREGRRARQYLPQANPEARAAAVFANEPLSAVSAQRDNVGLLAFLGAPERSRSGATGLHVYVNGRSVRDRALSRAIAFAYGSVLPPGRYPTGVVHLDIPADTVDVNVHPQKAEVRFSAGRAVLDTITRLLAKELGTTAWEGPRRMSSPGSVPPPTGGKSAAPTEPDLLREIAREGYRAAADAPLLGEPGPFGSLRVLAQVRQMLILCEGADALYVIDQHAADERVRFARLRRSYDDKQVAVQQLLFPERVELTEAEATMVEERQDEFATVGLGCAAIGPTTIAVHSVPTLVRRAPPDRLLRDLLEELTRSGGREFSDAVDTALATMACHGAIRAGDSLSDDECVALLRALDEVEEFGGHCPHGRPVVMKIDFTDVERRLGR